MAFLPNEPGDSRWQVTDIDDKVVLIEDPGLPTETVVYRWDLTNSMGVGKAIQDTRNLARLSTEQRETLLFWLGYFYAHFSRR